MSSAKYIVGDVFDVLPTLEPGSVDLVVTSPPFLALRSYLPADHPDKGKELGSEATPGEFIDTMLDVVEACARVLAPHGTLVFELGDTYAGSGGAGGDYAEGGLRDGAPGFDGSARRTRQSPPNSGAGGDIRFTVDGKGGKGWPLDKSKVLIPQLFAIALAYGFNPLTGRQTEPWRVRNTVAWCRPNPPVGRDGDKFRPATSFLTVVCKERGRYWDGDAVRTPHTEPGADRQHGTHKSPGGGGDLLPKKPNGETGSLRLGSDSSTGSLGGTPVSPSGSPRRNPSRYGPDRNPSHGWGGSNSGAQNPAGAPLLDWWEIPTQPYAGSHYATYPANLVVPIIKSMCPQRVCRVCGRPSERITGEPEYVNSAGVLSEGDAAWRHGRAGDDTGNNSIKPEGLHRVAETLGWSDCACLCEACARWNETADSYNLPPEDRGPCTEKWRPGLVLDPFAGSGTTLQVATGHGREAIGIDIDSRNAELAVERIGGLFLTVEHHDERAVS